MRGYLDLLRPPNVLMAGAGCLLGSFVALGGAAPFVGGVGASLQAAAVAALFTGAGNALNDYFDREGDRVNHPERPIPSGRASPQGALILAVALFVPTLPWSLLLGWELLVVVAVNLVLMGGYELVFKRGGFRGNLLIAWLVGSLFLFGGLAVYETAAALQRVALLALLAALATLGREVVKDIQDLAGDADRKTLPMTVGPRAAGFVASGAFTTAVALSVLPFLLGVLGPIYLGAVAVADAIFIYAAWHAGRKPSHAQRAAKYAMVAALLAFLVGGLP